MFSFLLRKHQKLSKLSPSPPSSPAFRREKIPSFPHKVSIIFFTLMILALLPLTNQKLETKNETIIAKGKLSSLLYYCKSLFPPRSILQQTFLELQNVPSQKFHSKKYRSVNRLFIAKFAEFQKCRMFICIIFYSGKFHKQECRLFIVEFAEFQNVH